MADKSMWLNHGQFHCDEHRTGIPFYFVPENGTCAECSYNAPESYLNRRQAEATVEPAADGGK